MESLHSETVKTFGGTLLGLVLLTVGWTIYTGNGFYSSLLFLTGSILLPTGLIVLATALTGGLGETPWNIIAHYRNRERNKA